MSPSATVGYIPYRPTARSAEAGWLGEHLSLNVHLAERAPSLNDAPTRLPPLGELGAAVRDLVGLSAIVAEGPAGFLWAAVLRAHGFAGDVTVLPYLNPRRWQDVAMVALYRLFAQPGDRIFAGSAPSAAVYGSLGLEVSVGEPYGIDAALFRIRPAAARTRVGLGIPHGRMLLFAGRMQPDKDVYRLLRASLRARLLFDDLQVVIASHVEDRAYAQDARRQLKGNGHVHFVADPAREQLADLYNAADVFVTASTSGFETFGRAPAEALACGTPAIAPRYDGFVEVLDQPGGTLVDVEIDPRTGAPHVDEELLLRAIYDALSSPRPPGRTEVSAIARCRFGRAGTIRQLAYLGRTASGRPSGAPAAKAPVVADAAPALPDAWLPAIRRLAASDPADAVAWFWEECEHGRLAADDAEFAAEVRRALCPRSTDTGQGLRACR